MNRRTSGERNMIGTPSPHVVCSEERRRKSDPDGRTRRKLVDRLTTPTGLLARRGADAAAPGNDAGRPERRVDGKSFYTV